MPGRIGDLLGRLVIGARGKTPRSGRDDGSIGDAAFRVIVQELDWAELSAGAGRHE